MSCVSDRRRRRMESDGQTVIKSGPVTVLPPDDGRLVFYNYVGDRSVRVGGLGEPKH